MEVSRDEIRAAVAAQLGSPATDIADHDDLIQLGLNSMRMMALAGGWRKRGSGITFADLAGSPTIESLARAARRRRDIKAPQHRSSGADRAGSRSTHRSRSAPCNMRTGSVAPTSRSWAVSPRTSTSNSMVAQSIQRSWNSGIRAGRYASNAANPIPAGRHATDDDRAGQAGLQCGRSARTEPGCGGHRTGGVTRA